MPSRTISNTSQTVSELDATDRYDTLGRKHAAGSQPSQPPPPHIAFQQKERQGSAPIPTEMDKKSLDRKPVATSTDASLYPSRTSSRTAQADISTNVTPTKSTSVDRSNIDNKQGWDNFKLGEVPRDRKRADTSASAPMLDDISMTVSSARTATQDSGHATQKPVDASDASVSSPGNYSSVFSHSTTASNSSGNITIDLSESLTPISRKEVPSRTLLSSERLDSKPDRSYQKPTRPPISGYKFSHSEILGSTSLANALTDTPMLSLPLRTPVGDFSQDADIARILGSDSSSPALLRKVSNAVRHGRSFSDLAGEQTIAIYLM